MSSELIHVGIDDTDSLNGRCTTHVAFKIVNYILQNRLGEFVDYPLLIRLNPNVPWKTRGNGAVCLRLRSDNYARIVDYVAKYVENNSALDSGANPGVAILAGKIVPEMIQEFGRRAMYDILSLEKAKKIARKFVNMKYILYGNGQGLIGALAAIGTQLWGDYTFEAIAYRLKENCNATRKLDPSNVIRSSNETFPNTFNNYDFIHNRVLIAPHGPDPVFCGIRGENAEIVVSALNMIKPEEELDGYMVFRSNQGTNMHLLNELDFGEIKPHVSGFSVCRISKSPIIIHGGHVIFEVEDDWGESIAAAVYEPTGITNIASMLRIGDIVEIGFGVREATSKHQIVLNIEYLSVLRLEQTFSLSNPICEDCNRKMKSEGKNKGFQCESCGSRNRTGQKIRIAEERELKVGLYIPSPKSHRHLTKPYHRYDLTKSLLANFPREKLSGSWISSSLYGKQNWLHGTHR